MSAGEAQRTILDAVARDIGGTGARGGLVGQTRDFADAWADLTDTLLGSDGPIGETAASIVRSLTAVIDHVNAALDQSATARLERLRGEQATLDAQLRTNDFGVTSWWPWSNTDPDRLAADARDRLAAVNRELAVLEEQHRRAELAAAIAAEDRLAAERLAKQGVLARQLEELHGSHEARLRELTQDRLDRVYAWEGAQLQRLEGLRQEHVDLGMDTAALDAVTLSHSRRGRLWIACQANAT